MKSENDSRATRAIDHPVGLFKDAEDVDRSTSSSSPRPGLSAARGRLRGLRELRGYLQADYGQIAELMAGGKFRPFLDSKKYCGSRTSSP